MLYTMDHRCEGDGKVWVERRTVEADSPAEARERFRAEVGSLDDTWTLDDYRNEFSDDGAIGVLYCGDEPVVE